MCWQPQGSSHVWSHDTRHRCHWLRACHVPCGQCQALYRSCCVWWVKSARDSLWNNTHKVHQDGSQQLNSVWILSPYRHWHRIRWCVVVSHWWKIPCKPCSDWSILRLTWTHWHTFRTCSNFNVTHAFPRAASYTIQFTWLYGNLTRFNI